MRPWFQLLAAFLCFGWLSGYVDAAAPRAPYHRIKAVRLGAAEAGGDYFDYITVDAAARRLYLTHGTEVQVLDADTFAMAGVITGLKRCHGVALVPELGRGFISDGEAGEAVIFDLKTLKILSRVKADADADSILYDPVSKRIFVFNGKPKSCTVIDPAEGTVIATVPLGGAPEQAVTDGKGTIYNNLEDTNEVIAIDSRTLEIKSRWPVKPAGQPVSIAMDRERRRLFIGGRKPALLVMMDADTGKVVGDTFSLGESVDGCIFDPVTSLAACSTGQGTLHILHVDAADKIRLVQTMMTEYGARTMALDPKTHNLFLDTVDYTRPTAPDEQRQPIAGSFHLLVYGH